MTEHKFGTWYPIEELKEFDVEVLMHNAQNTYIGFMGVDCNGEFDGYWEREGEIEFFLEYKPTHFMPLPPPPEEKK